MFKVKVYKVYPKNNPGLWYYVDAPSKRIAKWSGANIINLMYSGSLQAKDMVAERYKVSFPYLWNSDCVFTRSSDAVDNEGVCVL